jgi:hypothetical protein
VSTSLSLLDLISDLGKEDENIACYPTFLMIQLNKYTCNPSYGEAEAGGPQIISLGNLVRPCFKLK